MEDKEKKWTLIITQKAERKLASLTADEQAHVRASLDLLVTNPEQADVKRMKGKDQGMTRQRIGRWRAVFQLDAVNKVVVVVNFGARGDVYKK